MGFWLRIETEGGEFLKNKYPGTTQTGGNAVPSFLIGLAVFCARDETDSQIDSSPEITTWYQSLEQAAENQLCPVCYFLINCIWADGGDFFAYGEDEYDVYLLRSRNSGVQFTENEFRSVVRSSQTSWKSIDEVIKGVQFLLELFRNSPPDSLKGFYEPANTIPDFEALYLNLKILADRGNDEVRLNFF